LISDEIVNLLRSQSIDCKIHEHEAVVSIDDVKTKTFFPHEKLLKTLVFKNNRQYILIVIPGDKRLDYKKLSKCLNVSRQSLIFAQPGEVQEELRCEIGGVSPIIPRSEVLVLIDKNAKNQGVVFCGAGERSKTLEIKADDLIKASNARVADIIEDIKL